MSWPEWFFYPHTVQVKDLQAGAGMGDSYAAPRALRAEVKDEQRIVRNRDGAEVVSNTQVKVHLDTDVPVGSLVTVWQGQAGQREAEVLAVARHENAPPLDAFLVLSLE